MPNSAELGLKTKIRDSGGYLKKIPPALGKTGGIFIYINML